MILHNKENLIKKEKNKFNEALKYEIVDLKGNFKIKELGERG